MKPIFYIIIFMMLFSCGSRSSNSDKQKSIENSSANVNNTTSVELQNSASASVDFESFLNHYDLSVSNAKTPYQLSFNGVVFSGDADLSFKKKEEKAIYKSIVKIETTYKSRTTYKSEVNYKTITTYKSKESESQRPMWWVYVLIFLVGFFLKPFLKLINK